MIDDDIWSIRGTINSRKEYTEDPNYRLYAVINWKGYTFNTEKNELENELVFNTCWLDVYTEDDLRWEVYKRISA